MASFPSTLFSGLLLASLSLLTFGCPEDPYGGYTPSPTPTPQSTPTATPAPTPTATPVPTGTPTATATPSPTVTTPTPPPPTPTPCVGGDADGDGICDPLDTCPGFPDASCTTLTMRGGTSGGPSTYYCPFGTVPVGVRVRYGDWADSGWIVCRELLNATTLGTAETLQGGWGNPTGGQGPFDFRCDTTQTDGVMVGLQVWEGSSSPYVNSFGPICQQLSDYGASSGAHTNIWLLGNESGTVPVNLVADTCPDSRTAIGLSVRSGLWTDAIGAICGTSL